MKLINLILNHILIPLFTILFVTVVGLAAAMISGLIEYCILQELFYSEYQKLIPSAAIALILVIVLEFTKIYLHFFKTKLENNSPLKKCIKTILSFLVGISCLCTIIFGVSTFHLASYNVDKVNAEIKTINEDLKTAIADSESKHNKTYFEDLKPYEIAKTSAHAAVEDFDPTGLSSKRRAEKLTALTEAANKADAQYTEAQIRLSEIRDTSIQNDKQNLQKDAEKQIARLTNIDSPEIAAKYDNPIIAQFLTVLAQILFNASTYPRFAYLLVTILFSILIAVLLEWIISICFGLISYPFDTLINAKESIGPKLQPWCNKLIITVVKATCALFISIVIMAGAPVNIDRFYFLSAVISCCLAIMLVQHFVAGKTNVSEKQDHFIYAIRDSLLEGILSFMGCLLLGFLFGKEALKLDISTIAIGIGSTLSSCVGYAPKYLIENLEKLNA